MIIQDPNAVENIRRLHTEIIEGWNSRDAAAMTGSWTDTTIVVGFDGSQMHGREMAEATMAKIFADHEVARYVCIVRGIRQIAPGVAVLEAHVGMIPPGKDNVMPDRNAVQTLIAVQNDGEWRTEIFQNTPAKWDGREKDVAKLSKELQAVHDARKTFA